MSNLDELEARLREIRRLRRAVGYLTTERDKLREALKHDHGTVCGGVFHEDKRVGCETCGLLFPPERTRQTLDEYEAARSSAPKPGPHVPERGETYSVLGNGGSDVDGN